MALTREHILPGNKPSELKHDPFLGGLFFQFVDDWILSAAEQREDTWQFLLGVRRLPPGCYDFFEAALSVSVAANKLMHMSYRGATVNRSLLEQMNQARAKGDNRAAEKSMKQFFRASYRHGFWQGDLANYRFKSEAERIEFVQLRDEEEGRLCKQHGRNWRTKFKLPSTEEIQSENQASHLMVNGWLRWGFGEPGLCFYSGKALADLLSILLPDPRLNDAEYCKKIRQRLGLKQPFRGKPIVTEARRISGGLIEITCPNKKGPPKHQLSAHNGFSFGRRSYPIYSLSQC